MKQSGTDVSATSQQRPGDPLPFVSVIVPVFNDAERLRRALASLERQSYPPDAYEVVVVDNASDDSPRTVVDDFPHARLVYEGQPGSYSARNRGVQEARGPVLAFTDADCEASPGWLSAAVAALASLPNFGIVAGAYQRLPEDPSRPTMSELFEMVTHPCARDRAEREHFALTGNLVTHQSLFEAVGGFDGTRLSLEDKAWCLRCHAAGFPVIYCEEALVTETGARSSLGRHILKTRRLVGGKVHRAARKASEETTPGSPKFVSRVRRQPWKKLFPSPAETLGYMRHPGLSGPGQRLKVLWIAVFTHYVSGFERLRLLLGGKPERR